MMADSEEERLSADICYELREQTKVSTERFRISRQRSIRASMPSSLRRTSCWD